LYAIRRPPSIRRLNGLHEFFAFLDEIEDFFSENKIPAVDPDFDLWLSVSAARSLRVEFGEMKADRGWMAMKQPSFPFP
jgi:hypothetical protein